MADVGELVRQLGTAELADRPGMAELRDRIIRRRRRRVVVTALACAPVMAVLAVMAVMATGTPDSTQVVVGDDVPSVVVEAWSPLDSSGLYVLDTGTDDGPGSIDLVDPAARTRAGRIRTGPSPDIALSADGSHLFVTTVDAERQPSGSVTAIETATGAIAWEVELQLAQYRGDLRPYPSPMTTSADSTALYVDAERHILVLDVVDGVHLAQVEAPAGCQSRILAAGPGRTALLVCATSGHIHRVDPSDHPALSRLTTAVPRPDAETRQRRGSHAADPPTHGAVTSPDGTMLYITTHDFEVHEVDVLADALGRRWQLPRSGDVPALVPPLLIGGTLHLVAPGAAACPNCSGRAGGTALIVLDLATDASRLVELHQPAFALARERAGRGASRKLYVTDSSAGVVREYDLESGALVELYEAGTPARLLAAPFR